MMALFAAQDIQSIRQTLNDGRNLAAMLDDIKSALSQKCVHRRRLWLKEYIYKPSRRWQTQEKANGVGHNQ